MTRGTAALIAVRAFCMVEGTKYTEPSSRTSRSWSAAAATLRASSASGVPTIS